MNNLKNIGVIVFISVLAFLFYSFVWQDVNMTRPDTIGYMAVKEDISDGKIDNASLRTLGYPLLLLVTSFQSDSYTTLLYIQLLMYLLSVIALSSILYELNVSKKMIYAFSIISLLPYNIVMTTVALTETLTVFTLVSGFYFFFRWLKNEKIVYIVLSSLFFSYAAITRPTYQFVLLVFIFILIFGFKYFQVNRKKLVISVFSIGMTSFILLGSLSYLNYTKFNFLGLTPIMGFNLCNKTVPILERISKEDDPAKKVLIKYRDKQLISESSSHKGYNYIWQDGAIEELELVTGKNVVELSEYLKGLHFSLIIKAPRPYLKEVVSAIALFWFPHIKAESIFSSNLLMLVFILIHFLLMLLFFLFLSLMIGTLIASYIFRDKYRFFDKKDELYLLMISVPLLIVFYTMFISALVEAGDGRFRTVNDLFIYFFIFSMFSFLKGKVLRLKAL